MIGTLIGLLDLMEKLKSIKWTIKRGMHLFFNCFLSDFVDFIFYTNAKLLDIEGGVKFQTTVSRDDKIIQACSDRHIHIVSVYFISKTILLVGD